MHESTSIIPEDDFLFDPAEVQLHDYQVAREDSEDRKAFVHEFVAELARTTSGSPEGRNAWADALKAVSR